MAELVAPGSRVLDVGCGDGELLRLLPEKRDVDGRGIEISQQGVNDCVAKGLSVIQGDADADLADYPDDGFDYVDPVADPAGDARPRVVLEQCCASAGAPSSQCRISAIGGCAPSWRSRGRMPVTESLAHSWYDTPNIHFCTIADFVTLAREVGATIDKSVALDRVGRPLRVDWPGWASQSSGRAGDIPVAPGK